MSVNILLTTLGTSWAIVPELYGFTNPQQLPLYRNSTRAGDYEKTRHNYGIAPVDELWIITTTDVDVAPVREWCERQAKALNSNAKTWVM